jgi:serine/threonine protein kinase
MPKNRRIVELVRTLEHLRQEGAAITPEELLRDCPEMLPEMAKILRTLTAAGVEFESATPVSQAAASEGDAAVAPGAEPHYGRFAVQRLHARGGLGEVHVAVDEELHRAVALKRMQQRFANDQSARRRFLNEAAITARLEHPGIVPIYGLVQDDRGQPCYAMRFIEGESLAAAIKRFHGLQSGADVKDSVQVWRANGFNSLAFRQLLQRFISVCQTMAYAHSKNVLHRDIKPSNIMLGPFGETLVVDWGLAREAAPAGEAAEQAAPTVAVDDSASTVNFAPTPSGDHVYTQAGQALGTPGYMAPEQAAGRWKVVGPRSDIYSLGATLFELLTGERAARGEDVPAVLQMVQAGDFPTPRKVRTDVPKALEAICLRAMRLKPEERYASASELSNDLENWLADEPVTAMREPWFARAGRWIRKHRTLVTSAATALLACLLAAAIGAIVLLQKNRDLDFARQAEERRADGERHAKTRAVLAEAAAKEDHERAKNERDIAVAVRNFLQHDLLRQASPWTQASTLRRSGETAQAAKYNPTVLELVDRAALHLTPDKIEQKFPNQPSVQLEILETVSEVYVAMAEDAKAVNLSKTALEIHRRVFGDNHRATLLSRCRLAGAYFRAHQWADAAAELVEILRGIEGTVPRDSANNKSGAAASASDTPSDLSEFTSLVDAILAEADHKFEDEPVFLKEETNAAQISVISLRLMEANAVLARIIKQVEARLGADDYRVQSLRLLETFGVMALGRQEDAARRCEIALKSIEAKLGPTHAVALLLRGNLANLYDDLGNRTESIRQLEKILKYTELRLGPDHPHTVTSIRALAGQFVDAGQAEKALPLLEDALVKTKKLHGDLHPETLAAIYDLANGYKHAAKLDKALPLYEECLAKHVEKYGPNHVDTISALQDLAEAYQRARQTVKAIALFQDTLDRRREALGQDHPDVLKDMRRLANACRADGQHKRAVALQEEELTRHKALKGPDNDEVWASMNNLAVAYQDDGQLGKAVALYQETLEKRRTKLGAKNPNTLITMFNLASAYRDARQWDKAEALYEEVLALRKAYLGSNHVDTLETMDRLATVLQSSGQIAKALPLYEETLARRKEHLGGDHVSTLVSMNNLAVCYQRSHQLDRAIPLFEESLKLKRSKLGVGNKDTLITQNNLIDAYFEDKQDAKAVALLRESLSLAKIQLGDDKSKIAAAQARVGLTLLKYSQPVEAEPILRECLAIRAEIESDAWTTFNTQSMLGEALFGQKKSAEAETLLLAGYEGMKRREASIPLEAKPRLNEAVTRLVKYYESVNKPEEAAKWKMVLAAFPVAEKKKP